MNRNITFFKLSEILKSQITVNSLQVQFCSIIFIPPLEAHHLFLDVFLVVDF